MEMPTVNSITTGAKQALQATSDFVVWSGHKIAAGWNNYVVPSVTKIWEGLQTGVRTGYNDYLVPGANKTLAAIETGYTDYVKPAAITTKDYIVAGAQHTNAFVRTGTGVGSIGIAGAVGLVVLAESNKLDGNNYYYHRIALRVAAVSLAVASGVALAQGSTTIL